MAAKPLALDAYNALAEAYAAVVDTKPHIAFYDELCPILRLDSGVAPREQGKDT